jgi:hypothetical protein
MSFTTLISTLSAKYLNNLPLDLEVLIINGFDYIDGLIDNLPTSLKYIYISRHTYNQYKINEIIGKIPFGCQVIKYKKYKCYEKSQVYGIEITEENKDYFKFGQVKFLGKNQEEYIFPNHFEGKEYNIYHLKNENFTEIFHTNF